MASHSAVAAAVAMAAIAEIQLKKLKELIQKGMLPAGVHEMLVKIYGKDVYSYKLVGYYRGLHLRRLRGEPAKVSGRHPHEWVDEGILELRHEGTRISANQMANCLHAPRRTVLDHFHALGANYLPLISEPHTLTDT